MMTYKWLGLFWCFLSKQPCPEKKQIICFVKAGHYVTMLPKDHALLRAERETYFMRVSSIVQDSNVTRHYSSVLCVHLGIVTLGSLCWVWENSMRDLHRHGVSSAIGVGTLLTTQNESSLCLSRASVTHSAFLRTGAFYRNWEHFNVMISSSFWSLSE